MAEEIRSADQMVKMVESDPELVKKLRTDPGQVIQELALAAKTEVDRQTYQAYVAAHDPWLYRFAVITLSILALTAAVGAIVLASGNTNPKTPEVLVALGSAAVGALVGLFAPSPTGK